MIEIYVVLALVVFYGICTDVQETIEHHWNRCIFARLPGPVAAWFRSDWLRRFNNRKIEHGPRKLLGVPVAGHLLSGVAQFFWDGWHFFKGLKILALGAVVAYLMGFCLWWQILLGAASWATLQGVVHFIFYSNLFLFKEKAK